MKQEVNMKREITCDTPEKVSAAATMRLQSMIIQDAQAKWQAAVDALGIPAGAQDLRVPDGFLTVTYIEPPTTKSANGAAPESRLPKPEKTEK